MPGRPPHSYVGGMSQLSHPPTLFAHPFALWTQLRDRRARRLSTRPEPRRTHWDQVAWQRWADQPPAHPLVAGGRSGSTFSMSR